MNPPNPLPIPSEADIREGIKRADQNIAQWEDKVDLSAAWRTGKLLFNVGMYFLSSVLKSLSQEQIDRWAEKITGKSP